MIHTVSWLGYLDLLRWLLNVYESYFDLREERDGNTAIMLAEMQNHSAIVEWFLETYGAFKSGYKLNSFAENASLEITSQRLMKYSI